MKLFRWLMVAVSLLAWETALAQTSRLELSLASNMTIVDGNIESTTFIRLGRPIRPTVVPEFSLGVDHRRKSAAFLYHLAVRKDFPQPAWVPFLLVGFGGETVIVGPYLETRPMLLAGAGAGIPVHQAASIRIDYQFQRVYGAGYIYHRHYILVGVLVKWLK